MIRSDLFSEEAIDPETREFLVQFYAANGNAPSVLNTSLHELRKAREQAVAASPVAQSPSGVDEIVPGSRGGLTVRCFVPESPCGAYLHFHGGGFVMGGAGQQDPLLSRFARERGLAVISVVTGWHRNTHSRPPSRTPTTRRYG